ncbi:predicted protein [Naegleria gruberi]|uniref:Predicted protein n=1 Tax=Naegleria gruberi TaxID=5762 RepID=D2W2P5_NAEGR|nr:uncharacterized protein NAEGRDRAFT_54237 [Naegleria gruberi]EFC36653.1 predicted protein [Naegleria gruberi]|eukprot:XP_002669397.1 predicted protein [Naegleria gruberi strain NEG-M]
MPQHQIQHKHLQTVSDLKLNIKPRKISDYNQKRWNSLTDAEKRIYNDNYCCSYCDLHRWKTKIVTIMLNQDNIKESQVSWKKGKGLVFEKNEEQRLIPCISDGNCLDFVGSTDSTVFKASFSNTDSPEFTDVSLKCDKKCLVLVNQTDQAIYLIYNQIHKMVKMEDEYSSELVQFTNFSQFSKLITQSESRALCRLTKTKYLVLIFEDNSNAITFQDLITQNTRWFLFDLQSHSIEVVSPIVHPLIQQGKHEFSIIQKKSRKRKDFRFLDGDVNGGYSEALEFPQSFSKPKLFAFRPFKANPDLFQVHLNLREEFEAMSFSLNSLGFSFRFLFKVKSEAPTPFSQKQTSSFSDVSLQCFY